MRSRLAIFAFFCLLQQASAQNYTALNGSPYIGSLTVHNNPATIASSPLKWDLTLLGLQEKHTTNIVSVYNYSLISNPAKSEYAFSDGNHKRYAYLNANLNLLNARIALNQRSAIAFGVNLKSYVSLRSGSYNFIDTLSGFGDFFKINNGQQNLNLTLASGSWAEIYASYARTILDNGSSRLSAGLTLKLNRGLSGGFARLANGNFTVDGTADPVRYELSQADLDLGYSANYDELDNTGTGNKTRNFLTRIEGGGSFDVGAEYLVALPGSGDVNFDYDWKIGLSVLDIGFTQYKFGRYSTRVRDLKTGITDEMLESIFDSGIDDAGSFRDSLAGLYNTVGTYTGKFRITNPTRLVLNVDKFIDKAFYINADVSIDLSAIGGDARTLRDLNLLTITPRWETRRAGYYLPVTYSNRNEVWIGGAARIGPLLLGIHNWGNLLSKKSSQQGGLYFALIIKAPGNREAKGDKRLDCPPVNF